MSAAGRQELSERAIKAVVAAGYENVGTLEFLVDNDGNAYFIEINCRIQVEHPLTEMLTGIDLVTTQIKIASGEPLGFTQADVPSAATRSSSGSTPRTPSTTSVPAPARSSGSTRRAARASGSTANAYQGYEVPPFYDSLLGKLIVWGPTREAAIARGRAALSELVVRASSRTSRSTARCSAPSRSSRAGSPPTSSTGSAAPRSSPRSSAYERARGMHPCNDASDGASRP
jgi:acetyl-CoA carboxylase biotin carboxylase subunit